jgi:molybdenum cofactor biosynthesis enzyme MoaA
MLAFEDFQHVVAALVDTPLKDIQFSGGEPFANPYTLKMIQYVDENTDFEIGCATNATLLNEEIVKKLSKTRIKLNLQFPATSDKLFSAITQTGHLSTLLDKIQLLNRYNVTFGLNHCFIDSNFDKIVSVIEFAQKYDLPLKLLPDINKEHSMQYKEHIFEFLDETLDVKTNPQNGSIKWESKSTFQVKYVDAPCFDQDFEKCKNYAEIRLLPDMTLHPCIMKSNGNSDCVCLTNLDRNAIKNKFQEAWNSFISC